MDDFSSDFGALLISPPGNGKTEFCREEAKELGYYLVEIDASQDRTKAKIENHLISDIPIGYIGIYYLLDEADGIHSSSRAAINRILTMQVIKHRPNIRVRLTCNDPSKIITSFSGWMKTVHFKYEIKKIQDILTEKYPNHPNLGFAARECKGSIRDAENMIRGIKVHKPDLSDFDDIVDSFKEIDWKAMISGMNDPYFNSIFMNVNMGKTSHKYPIPAPRFSKELTALTFMTIAESSKSSD